jgi:hypothetical protein
LGHIDMATQRAHALPRNGTATGLRTNLVHFCELALNLLLVLGVFDLLAAAIDEKLLHCLLVLLPIFVELDALWTPGCARETQRMRGQAVNAEVEVADRQN